MLKRVTTRIRCSPEYAAFQECYPDILTAIQSPEHLANVLFAKNVIDNEVKAQVHLDPQTIMKKGRILLDAVEQAIRADPESFHVFTKALYQENTSGVQTVCLKLKRAFDCMFSVQYIIYHFICSMLR